MSFPTVSIVLFPGFLRLHFLLHTARDKDWCQGLSGNKARVCAGSRKVRPHFRGGQENIECGGRQSEGMKERLCRHSWKEETKIKTISESFPSLIPWQSHPELSLVHSQASQLLAVSEQRLVLQARLNQPQCRSFSAFHAESNPCCGWLGLAWD